MKKNYVLTTVIIILGLLVGANHRQGIGVTFAQEEGAAATAEAQVDETIKNLKEKIAAKVAELSQNNKKIATGYITQTNQDTITIKTGEEKTIKVIIDDSVTQLYSLLANSPKAIRLTNLTRDDFVIVTGPLIEDVINANIVYKSQPYLVQSGKIIEVDKGQYTIKVITEAKDEFTLDIETATKQQILDTATLKITPIGFSKLKEGDVVHFSMKKNLQAEITRGSAMRLLIIPQDYFNKKSTGGSG